MTTGPVPAVSLLKSERKLYLNHVSAVRVLNTNVEMQIKKNNKTLIPTFCDRTTTKEVQFSSSAADEGGRCGSRAVACFV